jgi:excisionase family DNA binding protein
MGTDLTGYITTKQAAKLTGYTKDYVGQLARDGYIDSKKDGRKRIVKITDLFEYIQAKNYQSSDDVVKDSAVDDDLDKNEVIKSADQPTVDTVPVEELDQVRSGGNSAVSNQEDYDDSVQPYIKIKQRSENNKEPVLAALNNENKTDPENDVADDVAEHQTVVTKKIISPWVHHFNQNDGSKTSSENYQIKTLTANNANKPSLSNELGKSDLNSSSNDTSIQYSQKKYNKDEDEVTPTNKLPMLAAGGVLAAGFAFMFLVGTLISQNMNYADNSNAANLANIAELNLGEQIGYGWYQLINNFGN